MTNERIVRGVAGFLILLSLVLAYKHNPLWVCVVVYVGIILFQSLFTNWTPLLMILNLIRKRQERRQYGRRL